MMDKRKLDCTYSVKKSGAIHLSGTKFYGRLADEIQVKFKILKLSLDQNTYFV